jgi:hypothetical protein
MIKIKVKKKSKPKPSWPVLPKPSIPDTGLGETGPPTRH